MRSITLKNGTRGESLVPNAQYPERFRGGIGWYSRPGVDSDYSLCQSYLCEP